MFDPDEIEPRVEIWYEIEDLDTDERFDTAEDAEEKAVQIMPTREDVPSCCIMEHVEFLNKDEHHTRMVKVLEWDFDENKLYA